MKFLLKFLLFLSLLTVSSGLRAKEIVISASINPIYQIVLEIYGKNNSYLIINPKFSGYNFQLKRNDFRNISRYDLVFFADRGLEGSIAKIANGSEGKKFFELSKIKSLRILKKRDGSNNIDFHIWLNPKNSVKIARFIKEKICEIDQKNCYKYQKNLKNFSKKIKDQTNSYMKKLRLVSDKKYVLYHDGYQYFEDYFKLTPQDILSFEDGDLRVGKLRKFDKLAKKGNIKCIFNEKNDEKNSASRLAEKYNIKYQELDVIGGEGDNYSDIMENLYGDFYSCLNK